MASNGVCVFVSLNLRDDMILGSIFENGLIPQIEIHALTKCEVHDDVNTKALTN
jgi:hypothetical protein